MSECEGHPAGPADPMGETVYCDGSCALPDLHPAQSWRDEDLMQDGEPTDDEIYNGFGMEGGIAYPTADDSPGSLGENDWRL